MHSLFIQHNSWCHPKIIAHRGACALEPENSLPAFVAAGRLGVWAIETDLHMTDDRELVCFHNKRVDRLTEGQGAITDMKLAELRALHITAGNNVGAHTPDELRIPTFLEYLLVCRRYGSVPFIELKADIAGEALYLVRRMGLEEYCVFSSVKLEHLEEVRELSDRVFIHHIFSSEDNILRLAWLGYAGMSFKIAELDDVPEGLVERVHEAGLRVCFRAADTPEIMRRAIGRRLCSDELCLQPVISPKIKSRQKEKQMKAYERLIRYAKINTASSEGGKTTPSTPGQFELARLLTNELNELGVENAHVDDKCYVYGIIPASAGYGEAVKIGFIAHLDTSPDFCGEGVNPRVIANYDGGDLALGQSGRVLRVSDFPHLSGLCGKTLIVTHGNTLLGADDKAGIAEIMTMVERLQNSGEPHGQISICFTPDEEIGAGADYFDTKKFGADFAYTVDGNEAGEVVFENFNAAGAEFEIKGVSIHPGDAKDKMVNAQLVAMEINSMLPPGQTPRDTEGYEGFFHLCRMEGCVAEAKLTYIVRDHDAGNFKKRIEILSSIEKAINSKLGEGTAVLKIKEQYRNMREVIMPHYHLIENAMAAAGDVGIIPKIRPIRGGTDGARLSYMGLPCPNLGTGGYAFHGPYEHITAEGMEDVVGILLGIVRRYRAIKREDENKP